LELKKLVYLYIINYAKAQPDLTLMAINTFRKDSTERVNPIIRALAVRTMGCIGIEQMVEYLLGPLQSALNDEDAYVRKTAVMCVAKVYEINPERVE
jgi:AP-1 complex subunit beta-1